VVAGYTWHLSTEENMLMLLDNVMHNIIKWLELIVFLEAILVGCTLNLE
jgi:hypothetical protein